MAVRSLVPNNGASFLLARDVDRLTNYLSDISATICNGSSSDEPRNPEYETELVWFRSLHTLEKRQTTGQ
jgi:hypothetical protein